MIPEIRELSKWMQQELDDNIHKGDWKKFTDVDKILLELEWHKAKLLMAIKDGSKVHQKEYISDCCNIFLFLGNALGLFDFDIETLRNLNSSIDVEINLSQLKQRQPDIFIDDSFFEDDE